MINQLSSCSSIRGKHARCEMSHHPQALAGDVEAVAEDDDEDAASEAVDDGDLSDHDGNHVLLAGDSQPSEKRSRSESGLSDSESQAIRDAV